MPYISSIFHSFENKNVLYISLCFAVLFFGYNGAEKFLAVFYTQIGKTNIALITLAIIYLACVPSSIFTGVIIGKLGLRNTLFFSAIIYAAFVFGLITKDIILILFLAFLLQVCVRGYLDHDYEKVAGISHEENVAALTDAIHDFFTQSFPD